MESDKKKVVQLIHSLNMGGAETLVKEYALHLNKDEYDVCVLCYRHIPTPYDEMLKSAGVKVIYVDDERKIHLKGIPEKALNKIYRFIAVKKYFRRISPDVVHAHIFTNQMLKFSHLNKKTKVFYSVHSEPYKLWIKGPKTDKRDFKAAVSNVRKYGMRFIVLHDRMKEEVDELFGVDDSVVLNNGIDFDRFNISISGEEARKRIGIPGDAFVVGHVGRFSTPKNHVFLVRVFSELCRKNPNAFLLMVGSGELRNSIEDELHNSGLENRYMILENRSDIPEILSAMDVFVFPSLWEGLPLSIIEAQKMGVPCFASVNISENACVSNIITRMDLTDPAAWAEAILEYRKKKIEYYDIEQWSIDETVNKLSGIYKGII